MKFEKGDKVQVVEDIGKIVNDDYHPLYPSLIEFEDGGIGRYAADDVRLVEKGGGKR